jgi:hypothetical protein
MRPCRPRVDDPNQAWIFQRLDGQATTIINVGTGRALNADTLLSLVPPNGSDAQSWQIHQAGTIDFPGNPTG